MAGIQLTGLASGLDTEAIISQLMSIERGPRTQLSLRQAREQARHDALADISSRLSSLKTAATALRSAATWSDTQSADTSDPTRATARRTGGAGAGGYELEVTSLAGAEQRTFAYAAPAAATTLTIGAAVVDLAAGATLDDAVAAVNASEDAGVYAVAVSGRLVLSAKTTGGAGAFTAAGSALTEDVTALRPGADAQYSIDGVAHSSSTNVIANAIPGIEVTLRARTAGPVTISVGGPAADVDGVVGRVKSFVDAYNATVDAIRSRTTEKRVPGATTASAAKTGALFGDTGLNGVLTSLRGTLGSVAGIGLSTGAASATVNSDNVAGKLSFDETALRDALATDPTAVRRTLGGVAGTDGFAQALESVLGPLTQADGTFAGRISSSDAALKDVADSLDRFDARMTAREDLLRRQFTALETVLNRNNSLASSLAGLLG